MTEQQIETLEKMFPLGFVITVVGERQVQVLRHNPDCLPGINIGYDLNIALAQSLINNLPKKEEGDEDEDEDNMGTTDS